MFHMIKKTIRTGLCILLLTLILSSLGFASYPEETKTIENIGFSYGWF